jgi:hypothetical protein
VTLLPIPQKADPARRPAPVPRLREAKEKSRRSVPFASSAQGRQDDTACFNLPVNDPEIVLDGPDPGVDPGIEPEAVPDVTWSGAVAKGAKIKMILTSSSNATEGIALSARYLAERNIVSISSMSFGRCELHLGTGGNQF